MQARRAFDPMVAAWPRQPPRGRPMLLRSSAPSATRPRRASNLLRSRFMSTMTSQQTRPQPGLHPDPLTSAKAAGLRYVADTRPGIRRKRSGKGFVYLDPQGGPIRDPEVLKRIAA